MIKKIAFCLESRQTTVLFGGNVTYRYSNLLYCQWEIRIYPCRCYFSFLVKLQRLLKFGGKHMKQQPSERAVILGEYILEQNATVRAAAEWFGISKSTVHKDVSERLPFLNPNLYDGVKAVLEKNKQERHIRGGLATRKKYALLAQQKKQQKQKQIHPETV